MKKLTSNNRIISVTLLAVTMGLLAGIAGELIAREYIFKDLYGLSFGSEVNLSHTGLNAPNLVIKDAQNITVKQEEKVRETMESSSQSLVGIFEKKPAFSGQSSREGLLDPEQFYQKDNNVAQGFILTSDGWVIADNFGNDLTEEQILEDHVVITKENEIYEIEEIKNGFDNSFIFIRLEEAEEMPVKQLATEEEIQPGDLVVAMDWGEKSYLSSIVEKEQENGLVNSSDSFSENIRLANDLEGHFGSAFLFNLKGGIVGLYDNNRGDSLSINNFRAHINNLLKKELDSTPVLGVNYIDLEEVVIDRDDHEKGALVYPDINEVAVVEGSPAEEAGLQRGDIITAVNNIEVQSPDQTLNYLLQQYSPGDSVTITYTRDEEKRTATVELGGLEY